MVIKMLSKIMFLTVGNMWVLNGKYSFVDLNRNKPLLLSLNNVCIKALSILYYCNLFWNVTIILYFSLLYLKIIMVLKSVIKVYNALIALKSKDAKRIRKRHMIQDFTIQADYCFSFSI